MPEFGVYEQTYKELAKPYHVHQSRRSPAKKLEMAAAMTGCVTIPCNGITLANDMGKRRKKLTLHTPSPKDPIFEAFPDYENETCNSCPKVVSDKTSKPKTSTAPPFSGEVRTINELNITGSMIPQRRGKEIIMGINCYIFRFSLGVEGHGLWIPTPVYNDIIAEGFEARGNKSYMFKIPRKHWFGPKGTPGYIRILFAYMCEDWTWIFVDHNVLMTMHVLRLRRPVTREDLEPGSSIWPYIWSVSHGPSLIFEKDLAISGLHQWRKSILAKGKQWEESNESRKNAKKEPKGLPISLGKPIFLTVKDNQMIFNGYGAQETCDMLYEALMLPNTSTYDVCRLDDLWTRFEAAVFNYQQGRFDLIHSPQSITKLSYVSGPKPFFFNGEAHKHYVQHITTYRRRVIRIHEDRWKEIEKLGLIQLFNDRAKMEPDGIPLLAEEDEKLSPEYMKGPPPGANTVAIRMRRMELRPGPTASDKNIKAYTPLACKFDPGRLNWWPVNHLKFMTSDVLDDHNANTLGPYSFRVFVSANHTSLTLKGGVTKKDQAINRKAYHGPIRLQKVGRARRRARKTRAEIKKTYTKAEKEEAEKKEAPKAGSKRKRL
ncbi:hypothetical protein BJ912DRAFT_1064411 [Pholiota molesta]|nr:hypothetical protein BJ912DRAFT_1064411 [Pholiota molesta]